MYDGDGCRLGALQGLIIPFMTEIFTVLTLKVPKNAFENDVC